MSSASRVSTSQAIVASDGRRYAFADHNCFACGGQNPIGMHLDIVLGDGTASTEWVPTADFVGWEEKVHGGILATLLDEVMAWAPASHDSWAVTAEMKIRFRAPASPGERLVATGHVTEPATPDLPRQRGGPRSRGQAHRRGRGPVPRRIAVREARSEGALWRAGRSLGGPAPMTTDTTFTTS